MPAGAPGLAGRPGRPGGLFVTAPRREEAAPPQVVLMAMRYDADVCSRRATEPPAQNKAGYLWAFLVAFAGCESRPGAHGAPLTRDSSAETLQLREKST